MASSVFEHDSRFWDTFVRMCRAARPGGHIYVNAPSNGTVHRYPRDCWRFYPDAGLALAEHARSCGLEIDFVESFIGRRHSDVWNDFVAVFRKGPSSEPLNTAFVYQRYPSMNARTWQSHDVYGEGDETEDMDLINKLRARTDALTQEVTSLMAERTEHEELRIELDTAHARALELEARLERSIDAPVHAELQAQLSASETLSLRRESDAQAAEQDASQARLEVVEVKQQIDTLRSALDEKQQRQGELEEEVARLSEALGQASSAQSQSLESAARADGLIASLESNLRQRQEEIEQAWAQSERAVEERDQSLENENAIRAVARKLEDRLAKADKWVFDLARERRSLEASVAKLDMKLGAADRMVAKLEAREGSLMLELAERRAEARIVSQGLAELSNLDPFSIGIRNETDALDRRWQSQDHPLASVMTLLHAFSQANHALSEGKSMLHTDVEMLVERLTARERALGQSGAEKAETRSTLNALRAEAIGFHKRAAEAEEELGQIKMQQGSQNRTVTALNSRCAEKDRMLAWFRRVHDVLAMSNRGWRAMLPAPMRRRRDLEVLRRHGLFDGDAYLKRYPDVAKAGVDPLKHYIRFGMSEGRHLDVGA